MEEHDEELIRLLASDINMHFEQLVLAYQDRLYAFALSRVRNPHAAEEVVLSALERAYKEKATKRHLCIEAALWLFPECLPTLSLLSVQ